MTSEPEKYGPPCPDDNWLLKSRRRLISRKFLNANRDSVNAKKRARRAAFRAANPKTTRVSKRKIITKEEARLRTRKWREKNRERHIENQRRWLALNRERMRAYHRNRYRQGLRKIKDKEKRRLYVNKWARDRHAKDPLHGLYRRMSQGIRSSLKSCKSRCRWEALVGYTMEDLKSHLESLFTEGMTWAAFHRGEIHIDHIIPKVRFTCTSPSDESFKECWALSNLQPLWRTDNLRKNALTMEEFLARQKAA